MSGIFVAGLLVVAALVIWVAVQSLGAQKKSEAIESQMTELRRDLQSVATSQAQATGQITTLAATVTQRLDAVRKSAVGSVTRNNRSNRCWAEPRRAASWAKSRLNGCLRTACHLRNTQRNTASRAAKRSTLRYFFATKSSLRSIPNSRSMLFAASNPMAKKQAARLSPL